MLSDQLSYRLQKGRKTESREGGLCCCSLGLLPVGIEYIPDMRLGFSPVPNETNPEMNELFGEVTLWFSLILDFQYIAFPLF